MDTLVLALAAIGPVLLIGAVGFMVIGAKIDNVHHQINSRMDELIETTRELAHAQGVTEGAALERADPQHGDQ